MFGPNREGLPHVVSFSGGRSSGLMLRMLLDEGIQPIVLFANTGKEYDQTLDFVRDVEVNWSVPVVWLQYLRAEPTPDRLACLKTARMRTYAAGPGTERDGRMHWFETVDYETAARHADSGPFDRLVDWMSVLPNVRARACTAQLKIRTMQRYLWSQGIYKFVSHIGFRSDEWDRAVDVIHAKDRDFDVGYRFILAESEITKADIRPWWKRQPFDLALEEYQGNCSLCFLKRRGVKQRIARERPDLAAWWAEQEAGKASEPGMGVNGARWRAEKGHAVAEILSEALAPSLFSDDEPMECSCTAGDGLGSIFDDHC